MKKDELLNDELVISKIYQIRGQKVMLDDDLAELYEVETKRINEQIRRNSERFPEDFMFQLSEDEWGGRRYPPYAFHRTRRSHAFECAEQ